jgi:hypothetical protein
MVTGVTEVETVAEIVAETDLVDRLEEILVIDLLVVILAAVVIEVEIVVLDQVEAALEAEMTEVVTAEVAVGIEAVTEITVVAEIIGAVVEDHLVGIDAGKLLGQRFNKNNLEHNRKTNGSKEPCIR